MTLAPDLTLPDDLAELRRGRECICSICCGASEGAGYRPHTLKADCWCIGKSSFTTCREANNWRISPDAPEDKGEGAGLPRRMGDSANTAD